mmetsp:Transcript_43470/g.70540  ORF Transcript_43470/g.70540 Transcript_43470/m.70540 type:complete len:499 (+) Transcript_43470:104-1600(+)|eukprot:CAMPEP_0184643810 /NCGR_PEP_ID=MMETSP0308-20130426/631_1 /TAXON_ID=38269 /ORGANISM="Gloeochaete witrockiana, Strain SAG 46.84" /LENGTH=498 /DNA_ID=CAMNT_0027072003 /DNA_START=99 /DNA_END=1595 /DNA_ORIENTATION=+
MGIPEEDEKDDLWAEILRNATRKDNIQRPKHVLVLGDKGSGKSALFARIQKRDISIDDSTKVALGYSYIDLNAVEERDETEESSPKVNVWTLEGDLNHKDLLGLGLNAANLGDSVVVIALDMSKPWALMETLTKWLEALSEHVTAVMKNAPGRRNEELKDSIQLFLQSYKEPPEGTAPKPARPSLGTPSRPVQPSTITDAETETVKLPLGTGVLTINLGVPIIVVACKTDCFGQLEKEHDYRDVHFDFIQRHLRTKCLAYGATLIYLSAKEDKNCRLLLDYIMHRLFGVELRHRAQVLPDKDAVFVPAGWDSAEKITALVDSKVKASASEAFDDMIQKPTERRKELSNIAEIPSADEQEFLKGLSENVPAITDKSVATPRATAFADVRRSTTPVNAAQLGVRIPNRTTPEPSGPSPPPGPASPAGAAPNAAGATQAKIGQSEDALQSFFQNLLNRNPAKARTPDQSRRDALQELDRMRGGSKPTSTNTSSSDKKPGST